MNLSFAWGVVTKGVEGKKVVVLEVKPVIVCLYPSVEEERIA